MFKLNLAWNPTLLAQNQTFFLHLAVNFKYQLFSHTIKHCSYAPFNHDETVALQVNIHSSFFTPRKCLARWIVSSGRLSTIVPLMLCLALSLDSRSQTIPETFTPGWVRLDTAKSRLCGTGAYPTIRWSNPYVLTNTRDTVVGQLRVRFDAYQNGLLVSSSPTYQFTEKLTGELTFPLLNNIMGDMSLAGYDFRIIATLSLPGYPTDAVEIGDDTEGMFPGFNNDTYYSCNTYFSKPDGDLHDVNTWGRNADGTGAAPAGFDSINTYNLANRGTTYTMTGDWNVGGFLRIPANSALQINGFTLTVDTMARGFPRGLISGSPTSNLIYKSNRLTNHQLVLTPGSRGLNNFSVLLPAGSTFELNGDVSVYGVLTIGDGVNFRSISTDNLILKSSAERTARVAPFGANPPGVLGVTIERYIPARRVWRFLNAPVRSDGQRINTAWQEGATTSSNNPNPNPEFGTHITGGPSSLGFDQNPLTAEPSIKQYNVLTQNWQALPNTFLTLGSDPYFLFVRGDRGIPLGLNNVPATSTVLRSRGALRIGDQTYSVFKDGFTPIGNPYASPINFATITRTNVQNNFYLWDPKMGGENGVGAYVLISFNGSGYDVIPAAVSLESQYIQSGQAFFVQAIGGSPGSITIKESDKADTPSTDVFRLANIPGSEASPFDVKFSSNTPGLRISLQSLGADNQPALLDQVLSSYDTKFSDQIDQFDADKMDNVEENIAIVKDGHKLMAERSAALDKDDNIQLKTWNMRADKQYQLEFNPVNTGTRVTTAYLTDNLLKTTTAIDLTKISHVQFNVNGDAISSSSNRFSVTFKDAQDVIAVKSGISAFPNPVVGKTIQLTFANQAKGNYMVRLMNSAGQLIYTATIKHNGETTTKQLILNKKPVTGIYLLEVSNGNSKRSMQLSVK